MTIESNLMKYSLTITLTILASSHALLISWSKKAEKLEHNGNIVNLLVEILKCAMSLVALFKIWKSDGSTQNNKLSMPINQVSYYCIPAALCFMHKLLQYSLFAYMDGRIHPLTILDKTSIEVLSRIILKRKFTRLQLDAFILLCRKRLCSTNYIVLTFISGFSEVMKEDVIKKYPSTNINVQNFWLSIFGSIFNLVLFCHRDLIEVIPKGFFHGYSYICENIVSMVLKYADNIVKVYSTSVAMFLTVIASKFLFGFHLSLCSFTCFMLVLGLAILHGLPCMHATRVISVLSARDDAGSICYFKC